MSSAPADAPSWVQVDAACRHAWGHDAPWRKAARAATHEVHVHQLTLQARRAYAEALGERRSALGQDRHHAEGCPCAQCRRRRGEKALPTLRQQQEKRKRGIGASVGAIGYEPGDREGWLLTEHDACRWTRVVELERDPKDKITRCELRPEWLSHLDKLIRKELLEDLWANQPHLARAFCGCALDGRTQDNLAEAEGVSRRTIGRRLEQARAFLAARLGV